MTKEQIKQDIASWEERIKVTNEELEQAKRELAYDTVKRLESSIDDYNKIIRRKKWELMNKY